MEIGLEPLHPPPPSLWWLLLPGVHSSFLSLCEAFVKANVIAAPEKPTTEAKLTRLEAGLQFISLFVWYILQMIYKMNFDDSFISSTSNEALTQKYISYNDWRYNF